jgi:hypothetical protein
MKIWRHTGCFFYNPVLFLNKVAWTWNFFVAKTRSKGHKRLDIFVVVVLRAKISALEKPASRHIPSVGVRSGSWSPVRGWGAGWRLLRPPPRRRRMSPGNGRRGAGTSPYAAKLSWVSCSFSDSDPGLHPDLIGSVDPGSQKKPNENGNTELRNLCFEVLDALCLL